MTSTYLFARDEGNLLDVYIPFEWFNVMQGGYSIDIWTLGVEFIQYLVDIFWLIFKVYRIDTQGSESVIPCRPTDPDVKMTFNHRGRDITDQLDSNQFKYDPQRGLVIDRGTMVYHTGLLVCEASKGGKSNSYKAVLQFIPVEQPKTPSILEQGSDEVQTPVQLTISE